MFFGIQWAPFVPDLKMQMRTSGIEFTGVSDYRNYITGTDKISCLFEEAGIMFIN
jgi:hypothetical protein